MRLLEKAKAHAVGAKSRNYTFDHAELAVAYLRGEVTLTQAAAALDLNPASAVYTGLLNAMRAAVLRDELTISLKKGAKK